MCHLTDLVNATPSQLRCLLLLSEAICSWLLRLYYWYGNMTAFQCETRLPISLQGRHMFITAYYYTQLGMFISVPQCIILEIPDTLSI